MDTGTVGRYNRLSALPASLAKLANLVCLVLSGNEFYTVPEPVFSMTSLQWLWLSNNRIAALPIANLALLGRLQSLHANDNRLTSIDVALPDTLLELDISHNAIATFPVHFRIPNGAEVTKCVATCVALRHGQDEVCCCLHAVLGQ